MNQEIELSDDERFLAEEAEEEEDDPEELAPASAAGKNAAARFEARLKKPIDPFQLLGRHQTTPVLKRPRGPTPKGMLWDPSKGLIEDPNYERQYHTGFTDGNCNRGPPDV